MTLTGLPDFGLPPPTPVLHQPYGSGPFTVLPEGMDVPAAVDGVPQLRVTLVRGAAPDLPPAPYGVVELRLVPRYRLDDALAVARNRTPGATVEPFVAAGGFLRLVAVPGAVLPVELTDPVSMAVDGLDRARCTVRVTAAGAALLVQLLADGLLGVNALVELEYRGVAPRLPATVVFDPAEFLPALAGGQEVMAREDLLGRLATDVGALPLEILHAADLDPAVLAEALVDRVGTRFGAVAPAPTGAAQRGGHLRLPADPPAGRFTWDLREPVATTRVLVLTADPMADVRAFVQAHGADALVRRRTVPPLSTGQLDVTVTVNLPERPVGVLDLGVELAAPPRPPWRAHRVAAVVPLTGSADDRSARLRLAPGEPPELTSTTYVVVADGTNDPRYGPVVAQHGDQVRLGVGDFPVAFLPLRVDAGLLELCTVVASFEPADPGWPPGQVELDAAHPVAAFTQPPGAAAGALTLELRPLDGAPPLSLGPLPGVPRTLTAAALPGYGPQEVSVTVAPLPEGATAVDLVPEDRSDAPEAVTTVALTADRPAAVWRYLPASPFRAGYRWRHYAGTGAPAPWSPVQTAGTPLVVTPQPNHVPEPGRRAAPGSPHP